MRFFSAFVVFLSLGFSFATWADEDGAYLDRPYENHNPPQYRAVREDVRVDRSFGYRTTDIIDLIKKQTPVKSQGSRGTCSIFASTAMLEAMLVIRRGFDTNVDLSEEWLEYMIMRRRLSEGSNAWANFSAFKRYGMASEEVMPYIGETWKSVEDSELAQQRCGTLSRNTLTSCLLGHRNPDLYDMDDSELSSPTSLFYDPEFLSAREWAKEFKKEHVKLSRQSFSVGYVDEIKDLLRKGIPLQIGLRFYYGAWNHRGAEKLGMNRNMEAWQNGVVGYPERGSVDRKMSPTDPAGHAVVIVGYDDDVEVTTEVLMEDGTMKRFTHTGVYYFKNSWGTSSFGIDFTLEGQNFPGYGMITQDYANEYGSFNQLPIKEL